SPFGGPGATATSAAAGLPFAGVPSELKASADEVLAREPDHAGADIAFDPTAREQHRFNLRSLFGPRRWQVTIALVLLIAETVAMLAGPALTQKGIDDGVRAGNKGMLVAVVGVYLGVVASHVLINRARIRWTASLGESLMYEVRVRVFSHFQRLSLEWYTKEKAGVLLSRMTSDVDALTQLVTEGFTSLLVQGLTLVVVTAILLSYDVTLALILLVLVFPPLLAMTLWFRTASERGYNQVRDRIADLLADLSEGLSGIRVIAATNRRRKNLVTHREVVGRYRDANLYTARIGAIYTPSTEAVGVIAQAIVLLVGGKLVLDGKMELGELAAFVLYVTVFFAPIQQLVQLYNTYQQGTAALRKLADVLDTEPTVAQRPDAVDLPPITGRIELKDLTFGYDADTPVLTGVDLTIEAGETFALVGRTGAGKSTIAKLITRFYDPQQGEVAIDGHDLTTVTLRSLRSQLGVVPQEPFLFGGTFGDNLRFAAPNATDAELRKAVDLVGLTDLLGRMPDGLDSLVHERGTSMAAGERQLLALARAFLARPRVIVLDEATSSLDLSSETKIEAALDVLLDGRTAIIIAHRLATAMRADRIAVIEGGGIAELGTHDELISLNGLYAAMYSTWASHSEGPSF
ncbi:MAG: ABC transporter ATP-binding protein, partial [Actinomycetota bacterium]|nr:ABC transporter ATP-binding protein [Actinomycetota bacterium]